MAMLLGIPLEDAITLVGKKGATRTKDLRNALLDYRIWMSDWKLPKRLKAGQIHLARVRPKGEKRYRGHWIVLDKTGTILDPEAGTGMPLPKGWRVTSIYEIRSLAHKSYDPRLHLECFYLERRPYEQCWGFVRNTPAGVMACEGHRTSAKGRAYLPHPSKRPPPPEPPPVPKPKPRPDPCPGDPLTSDTTLDWEALSVPTLRVLHAVVAESLRLVNMEMDGSTPSLYLSPKAIREVMCRIYREGRVEHRRRGVPFLSDEGYPYPYAGADLLTNDELEALVQDLPFTQLVERRRNPWPPDQLLVDFSRVGLVALHVLYGAAAEVVDFSMLGRGVRPVAIVLYSETHKELKRRGVPPEFLCDLRL